MVYQHFTLVPALTGAENLVSAGADAPSVIDWRKERKALEAFLDRMPFRVPLDAPVSALAAGEKQKLEILKLLYLDQRFLILDEPTSVLTPGEADEVLGLLRDMAHAQGDHRHDDHAQVPRGRGVLRRRDGAAPRREGRRRRGRRRHHARHGGMMIGDTPIRASAARTTARQSGPRRWRSPGSVADDDEGRDGVAGLDLKIQAGEIVGIAGVPATAKASSSRRSRASVPSSSARSSSATRTSSRTRDHFDRFKVFGLPEEPLKNATVPTMSVAENMAFRQFDKAPMARSASGCRVTDAG